MGSCLYGFRYKTQAIYFYGKKRIIHESRFWLVDSDWSISSRARRWACAPTPRRKWPALTRTCWGAKAWRAFATAGRCCTRGPSARWLRASRCKWARKFTATPGARPIWKSCCWRWTACAPPAWPRKGRSRSISRNDFSSMLPVY